MLFPDHIISSLSEQYHTVMQRLNLETLRPSATTSLLELAALGLDLWLLVLVWSHAEVLDGLAGVLWSTEEDDVRASWCAESELIESDGLTTGGLDAGAGSRSEAEGADAELGNLEHAVVVGDSSNNGADLALVLLAGVLGGRDSDDLGERHRWGVDARHAQSPQDGGIELALRAAVQELVQLVQNLAVRVGAVGRFSVPRFLVMN